ncbi:MAG: triose-phosphate isomerase [Sphingomonas sp. 28-66-16]|nr:MAG: triose-phosphate isomerase [Sphingomonas sp. 28-66-16]
MYGLDEQLTEIRAISECVRTLASAIDVLVCVPATLISRAVDASGGGVAIGGEDCDAAISGAFTGDVSAEMLKDAGASAVIVGHSERRAKHHETDAMVAAKAAAAARAGLGAIICIGETKAQRDAGEALQVCSAQLESSLPVDRRLLAGSAIAYEPLWAIGSGSMPAGEVTSEVHAHIRQQLKVLLGERENSVPVLYGGSVTPDNATEILALPEVGGVLVGGASLRSADFNAIVRAAAAIAGTSAASNAADLAYRAGR